MITNSLLAMILGAVLIVAANTDLSRDDFDVFLGCSGILFIILGFIGLAASLYSQLYA